MARRCGTLANYPGQWDIGVSRVNLQVVSILSLICLTHQLPGETLGFVPKCHIIYLKGDSHILLGRYRRQLWLFTPKNVSQWFT